MNVYNIEDNEVCSQNIGKVSFSSFLNDNEFLSLMVLFAGTSSGRIVKINLKNMKEEFSIQGHAYEISSIISQFSMSKVYFLISLSYILALLIH